MIKETILPVLLSTSPLMMTIKVVLITGLVCGLLFNWFLGNLYVFGKTRYDPDPRMFKVGLLFGVFIFAPVILTIIFLFQKHFLLALIALPISPIIYYIYFHVIVKKRLKAYVPDNTPSLLELYIAGILFIYERAKFGTASPDKKTKE